MLHMGRYGPSEAEPFRCSWYGVQMFQAALLIGVPARLVSVGIIVLTMALPSAVSPVRFVSGAWYGAGFSCALRTTLTLARTRAAATPAPRVRAVRPRRAPAPRACAAHAALPNSVAYYGSSRATRPRMSSAR